MKILIVDDDEMNIEILKECLHDAGYETVIARDGLEALEVLKTEKVSAILLDWMMPNMDGIEFMKRVVGSGDELSEIPIIMQTVRASKGDQERGKAEGAYSYLTKPYTSELLLSTVSNAVQEEASKKKGQIIQTTLLKN